MAMKITEYGSFLIENSSVPHPDLIENVAVQDAKTLAQQTGMGSNQLLRYYYEVKSLQKLLRINHDFVAIVPKLLMLKAKVAFASSKKSSAGGLPPEFCEFIDHCVSISKQGADEFNAFCLFFESVLGFFYGWGGN
ncbi:MAG: type III-A CRISPR-associated protein Csm2 [bacterium]